LASVTRVVASGQTLIAMDRLPGFLSLIRIVFFSVFGKFGFMVFSI